MISCKLCGGLGNQLFQIFTTIAYAMKYKKPFFFLNIVKLGDESHNTIVRYTYWETLLTALIPFLKNMTEIPPLAIIREYGFEYKEIPENVEKNMGTLLVGYFQSPKYFNFYKEFIYKLLKLDTKKLLVKNKNNNLFVDLNSSLISMHFRFGDYEKYPHIYPLLDINYYSNALSYMIMNLPFKNNKIILYFCEQESILKVKNIIDVLKANFPTITFQRADDNLSDWEQMLLMSLCNHNIIANSTFSWWGAYLNSNVDQIVCFPDKWFMPEVNKDTSDLFLENWVPISLYI